MKLILFFILPLLYLLPCFSQKTERIHLTKYKQSNGLPSYNVRKVLQDSKGFMWVATQDGVSRFDGREFINYSKSSKAKHRICGVEVRELIEDSINNLLWVLPTEIGLNAINLITGNVVLTAPIPDTDTEEWNICMLKDGRKILLGTSTGVRIFDILTKKYIGKLSLPCQSNSTTFFETRCIAKDKFENYWVCCSGFGIIIYDGKSSKILATIPLSELNDINKSKEIRIYKYLLLMDNKFLFATSQGLRQISYSKDYKFEIDIKPCGGLPILNKESIEYIYPNKKNSIYISGNSRLFKFDYSLNSYTELTEATTLSESDWLNATQSIYSDIDGNIWLGCQEGLAFLSNIANPFTSFNNDKITNLKLDHVRSLCYLNDKSIMVGLRNGLVQISHLNNKYIKLDTSHLYHHIFQDKNGLVILSRSDGIFILKNGIISTISNAYKEFRNFSSIAINSHLFLNDTAVILGTESGNGILIWNMIRKTVRQIDPSSTIGRLSSGIVNNIYQDSKKNIWVLSDNVINILTPDLQKSKEIILSEKGISQEYKLYFDVCELDGYYWIASYGSGILKVDSNYNVVKVINTSTNLSNDGVYQIFPLDKDYILVTTNSGISLINIHDLNVKNYFERDGLHSNNFEEVAGMMKDSMVFAGGSRGFTIIEPTKFTSSFLKPKVYFGSINIEAPENKMDTTNLQIKQLEIPNNVLQTTLHLSALNYNNPEQTNFSYRIIEQSKDWINLSTQNFVTLIGLAPGTYHLQVKAANEDGLWSEPKELVLTFLPKWYQTWWFKILILAIASGLVYAFYQYRIRQLEKQHAIRKNIATDLHDDLGSTLNCVKVFTNLAISGVEQESSLQQVKQNLEQATTGLRDMIWVLDDSLDTVDELVTRLKQYAIPICHASGIKFEIKAGFDATKKQLTKDEKRNLFLVSKEAVNNSIKYSGASQIEIIIVPEAKKLSITIADNGKGFDMEKVKKGYGLKNMQYRASQIKFCVEILSILDSGTQIIIKPF